MDVDEYDDKCPSWLTSGQIPPVQLWAEHFLRPSKNRNVLYTKYLEERLAECKFKYGFLQPDQIFGMTLGELSVPSCGFKINLNFLNKHKDNRRQSKSNSKLGNKNSRSFRLFEDADMSSIVNDDSDLQIRAPSQLRAIRAPSPPSECFQDESIYDDLTEMFEDVEILPFESLNRKTRPSICSNDKRKCIKSTKDNRLLNQFEIFKDLSNSELLPTSNRKEETEQNAVVITEKSAIANKSILKSNSFKENMKKKQNFEKSVQFDENLENIHEYQPFEENESSTEEYRSPIDGNGERNLQDRSETFFNSSPNEASSIINEEHVDEYEIIFTELEDTPNNEETSLPSESIGEFPASPAPIEEEKDRSETFFNSTPNDARNVINEENVDKDKTIFTELEDTTNNEETTLPSESFGEFPASPAPIEEEKDRSETFFNSTPNEARNVINEENVDKDEIIFTELEDTTNNEETTLPSESFGEVPASPAPIEENKDSVYKNKQIDPQPLNVNTDTSLENRINQIDQHPLNVDTNSFTNNTNLYISRIESEVISAGCSVIGDVSLLIEKSQTEGFKITLPHSQNSLNESIICNSLDDSVQPASRILLKTKLKEQLDCGNFDTIQEGDIHDNSLQSDVAASEQDFDEFEDKSSTQVLDEETVSEQSDIDPENDYLSNSIIESDVDGEIEPLNVTLNKFGINEQDRSNIEVEQSEHHYSQNSDISSDVNVTDCNELEIPVQNVESQKIERKNRIYLECSEIPVRPENKMIFNEDSDVELFQEPRKREQCFYKSPRIPVRPAIKINNENRDVGSPEDLFKGEQRHHYESTRFQIRPGNKIIGNTSSYEETCGENNVSYFQTNNVKKQDQNLLNVTSTTNEKKYSYFQTSIPFRPENRKHLDRKIEGVILPEGCHNEDRLTHFQSELIPIHPINNDEHVSLSEEHIASQLFVMDSQSPNEHFALNSSSSKSSSFDETAKKITRKRKFTSIVGTSFSNMNNYLTGSKNNSPNYGIASPCSNDEGRSQHSTNYDLSLEDMINCDNDEPWDKDLTVKTFDRSSSVNIQSLLDDDYEMIKSDDSMALICNVVKKDKQNLESEVGTKKQSQIRSDEEPSTSLTMPPKKRKCNINIRSKNSTLQSSTKKNVLTSQTTNITDASSRSTVEMRKLICSDWLAQNEFFNQNSNCLGTSNPLTEYIRVPDPVLPVDNGGEEKFNKLPDIEFSSSEY